MRKLASIQKIGEIRDIAGADKIQVCSMENLGWECVIKKNEYKLGDLICYIECDSKTPDKPEFEFLRSRSFKVKIAKFKKQISQGLIVPLSILPANIKPEQGLDVTEALGIIHYQREMENEEEKNLAESVKSKSKILKLFMNFALFRWIYFKLNHVDKGWPGWGVGKTDEERIQTCAKIFMNNMDKLWYITEKVDGQSATYFYHQSMKWGLPKWIFGICSRNIWLKKPTNGSYWKISEKFDLENKFTNLKKELVCQGENLGPSIQKNKYGLKDLDFMAFNLKIDGVMRSFNEMEKFCNDLGLKTVPIIDRAFDPRSLGNLTEVKDVVQAIVKMSIGKSTLNPEIPREGLVFRLVDNPNVSFKIINPEFSLKYDKE